MDNGDDDKSFGQPPARHDAPGNDLGRNSGSEYWPGNTRQHATEHVPSPQRLVVIDDLGRNSGVRRM